MAKCILIFLACTAQQLNYNDSSYHMIAFLQTQFTGKNQKTVNYMRHRGL